METISPLDWGPVYKETIYGRWPVEPWNTATTFFFLIFVLYWWFRIKNDTQKHRLLFICLPIIFVGFVGGFLYHSLRNNKVWLLLDWGPIALTALVCSLYYWRTLVTSWRLALSLTLIPLVSFIVLLRIILPTSIYLSLGYPVLALLVLAPLILNLRVRTLSTVRPLGYAVLCVSAAITLRFLDKSEMMSFLPMGSHFLWHTMGALTCHFFADFNFKNPIPLKG